MVSSTIIVLHTHAHTHQSTESIYCCMYVQVFRNDHLGLDKLLGNPSPIPFGNLGARDSNSGSHAMRQALYH